MPVTSTAGRAAVTYRAGMGRQGTKRQLTSTERVLRWITPSLVVLAFIAGVAEIPAVPLALLIAAGGCFVALFVVSFQQGQAG